MKASIRLGRIAGVPLAAHWSAMVFPLLVAQILGTTILPRADRGASAAAVWLVAFVVALALVGCLVLHELAHAIVARRKGLAVDGITLWMLGGVTTIRGEMDSPRADLAVAIAGPATSLLCGAVSALAAVALVTVNAPQVVVSGAAWLAFTNGVLAAFNLLPGAPLDGGRVLRAAIWWRTGDRRRAEERAAQAGRTTGFLLMALGGLDVLTLGDVVGGLWLAMIGWFLLTAAQAEAAAVQRRDALTGVTAAAAVDASTSILPSYLHADAAARRAVMDDAEFCPVVDLAGHLVGVVDVDHLVQAALMQAEAPVARVMAPLPPLRLTTPDTPLVQALEQAGGRLPLVVVDHDTIVGVVTPRSVQRMLRRELVAAGSG